MSTLINYSFGFMNGLISIETNTSGDHCYVSFRYNDKTVVIEESSGDCFNFVVSHLTGAVRDAVIKKQLKEYAINSIAEFITKE